MYILLRETFIANAAGAVAPFVKISEYYDDVLRKPYATQADAQNNTPRFELTRGDLFSTYNYAPGRPRGVYYDGNGGYYTQNLPVVPGGGVNNVAVKLGLLPLYTYDATRADGVVDITGQYGTPPYQISLFGPGVNRTGTSGAELYPVRFYNLPAGSYLANITDVQGYTASRLFDIAVGVGYGRAALIYEEAFSQNTNTFQWRYNERDVVLYQYGGKTPGFYVSPRGLLLDGYLVSPGVWRRVYSAGLNPDAGTDPQSLVYFEDTSILEDSTLALHNLILFHPDTPQEYGGAVVEMDATHPPLTYTLRASRAIVAANQTGCFDDLRSGSYTVEVVDRLNKSVTVALELQDRYGKRWHLLYDDLYGRRLRMELWLRGYVGPVEDLCMDGTPVEPSSDGLSTNVGGQGDFPPAIGTEVRLNFLVDTDLFEPIITSSFTDRYCRADIYYDDKLEFRGFVRPDTYDAPMLSGPQVISISATDGLAALKDTDMLGHEGQRLIGHRPVLYTLLHCLSRCDVSLPLRLFVNRRELSMDSFGAPEVLATTNRTGYWDEDKNEPGDQRTVVDALAQLLGGTLIQREGTWQIRSALEAAKPAPGRAYKPAGTLIGPVTAGAPLAAVEPPDLERLYWLEGNQYKNVRAGWKSLTGQTNVGYLKNAYIGGGVFSDRYSWLGNGTGALRPVSGWRAVGGSFPLTLVRLGEKGSDYTTKWPRSTTYSTLQLSPFLQGPRLPFAPGLEAVPATLQLTGRFAAEEFYYDNDNNAYPAATNAAKATLTYEVVVDGTGSGRQFVEFDLAKDSKDTTIAVPLPVLPSGAAGAELRLYSWFALDAFALDNAPRLAGLQKFKRGETVKYDFGGGPDRLFAARNDDAYGPYFIGGPWQEFFTELTATNGGLGTFYLSKVAVQLTPQNATWEGEDNFRADGPAGNVRPTEALEVTHADPPRAAGLYSGNLYAFAKAAGLSDGTVPVSWQRSVDLAPAGLFENNVLDGLALRANPSRLVPGTVRYQLSPPPRLLDTLDTPFDGLLAGRRFLVAAVSPWNMKAAEVRVSLVEIGKGAGATSPLLLLPAGVRLTHQVYQYLPGQYAPYPRLVHGGGVRVRHL